MKAKIPGDENDWHYECALNEAERCLLVDAQNGSLSYQGPWSAAYAVITADLWRPDASDIRLVCRSVWGPKKINQLFAEDALQVMDHIQQRVKSATDAVGS
jgi:hypothetical protein